MASGKLVLPEPAAPALDGVQPSFTGRDELLSNLGGLLQQHRIVQLKGAPGAGRSAVADEYRRRNKHRYVHMWTVRASCRSQLIWDFVAIRAALNVPLAMFQDQEDVVRRTKAALAQHDDYLLIFEDVGHVTDLQDFLPDGAGHLLLTTTREIDLPGARLAVPAMTTAELHATVMANAAELCETLRCGLDDCGGNPLAARLLHRNPGIAEAWMEVREPAKPGLDALLSLVVKRVRNENAAAWMLLAALAWLNYDEVSASLLGALRRDMAAEGTDSLEYLTDRALVSRTGDAVTMHRSVQAAVLAACSDEQRLQAYRHALGSIHNSFPASVSDWRVFAQCAELQPHVERVVHAQELDDADPAIAARLLNRAALYLVCRSWFAMAEPLAAHAVRLGARAHDLGKDEVYRFHSNLSLALRGTGKLQEACEQATLAYRGTVEVLGPLHPTVGARANTLGMMHTVLGNTDEALQYNREAYHNSVANIGRNDERYPVRAHNYGQSLRQLGRKGQGRRLLASALLRARRIHGAAHPRVAFYSNAFGEALLEDGFLQAARHYVQMAATLNLKFYGDQKFMPKQVATDANLRRLAEAERQLGQT